MIFCSLFQRELPLLLLFCAPIFGAQNTNDCGGSASGSTVERGRYYYSCNNGLLVPQGCLSDAKERVPIGSTFRLNDYQMLCNLDQNSYLSVDYAACVIQDKIVQPGDNYETDSYWISCTKRGNYVVSETSGCIYKQKKLQLREKLVEDGYVRECRKKASELSVVTVGCVGADGREHSISETYTEGSGLFRANCRQVSCFSCTVEDGRVLKKAIGCIADGQQLQDGQLYYDSSDGVYRCVVGDKAPHLSIAGCLKRGDGASTETKTIGCTWVEGQSPQRFSVICEEKDGKPHKTRLNCFYEVDGQHTIDPQCLRIVNGQGVGCKLDVGSNSLRYMFLEQGRFDQAFEHQLQIC